MHLLSQSYRIRIAAACLALLLPLHAAHAQGALAAQLEPILDQLFHRISILTFSGVKPVAEDGGDAQERSRWTAVIDQARAQGVIHNTNVLFWGLSDQDKRTMTANFPDAKDLLVNFHVFNLRSLSEIHADAELIEMFHQEAIVVPASSNDAIELYRSAVLAGGYHYQGPRWANITIGALLGFPPAEVLAYADARGSTQEPWRGTVVAFEDAVADPAIRVLFSLDGYTQFTQSASSQKRKARMFEGVRRTIDTYLTRRAQGLSHVEIFNQGL